MKKFLKRLTLFIAGCLLLSVLILFTERKWLNSKDTFYINDSIQNIILGHSHAHFSYNDKLIPNTLNLASAGEAYFYTYIKTRKILERNKRPLLFFIEYSNNNITSTMDEWIWSDKYLLDRYRLYNAYTPLPERKLLYEKNPKSALLCDTRAIVYNAYYILKLKQLGEEKRMGGYFRLMRSDIDSLLQIDYEKIHPPNSSFSETNIQYLEKLVKIIQDHGSKIFFIRSPLHQKYPELQNEPVYQKVLKTRFPGIELLDFMKYTLPNSNYSDLQHLNYMGSEKYTILFSRLLKDGLLEMKDKQAYINQEIAKENERNR